jgi:hypothetical protein
MVGPQPLCIAGWLTADWIDIRHALFLKKFLSEEERARAIM